MSELQSALAAAERVFCTRNTADFVIVNKNIPLLHIIKTHQQINQRRLFGRGDFQCGHKDGAADSAGNAKAHGA